MLFLSFTLLKWIIERLCYLFVARPSVHLISASHVESVVLLDEGHCAGGRVVLSLVGAESDVLGLCLSESLHVRSRTEIGSGAACSASVGSQGGDAGRRALLLVPALQLVRLVEVGIQLKTKDNKTLYLL